jgi:dihydroflavonol-4-reductase
MKVLVTGATGFIGYHVTRHLLEKGFSVRALVREGSDASLLKPLNIEIVRGDIRDQACLMLAVMGCRQIYHVAGDYRIWVPDSRTMYEINVQGTKNVMQAALKNCVEKVVYTSTVGVLPASSKDKTANEDDEAAYSEMVGHYKKSKFLAEQEVHHYLGMGIPIVIVNPSTPIGAFDRKPTPTGQIVVDFLNGKIPAYLDTGLNIVDVEDVAAGHLLAAQYGRSGERYILGHKNMALREFLACIAEEAGTEPPNIRLPYLPILLAAYMNEALSQVTKTPPRIPLTGVKLAKKYMYFDCTKAVMELKLPQSPIEQAVKKSIRWYRENGYVHAKADRRSRNRLST